jgi:hypothetical protein
MARPVYPHELCDPDFQWLISNYKESHPNLIMVESTFLPLILIQVDEAVSAVSALALPDFTDGELPDIDEP